MNDVPGLVLDSETRHVELDGTDLSGATITINDAMQAGHCVRGVKRWFGEKGFSFSDFLKEGIPAYDFLSTEDGHAIGIARNKIEREHG